MAKLILSSLGLLIAAVLGGCAHPPPSTSQPEPIAAPPAVRYAQLRGMLTPTPTGSRFTPCDSSQQYGLVPGSALEALYEQLAYLPGQTLYAEFSARLQPTPARGPGAGLDAQLVPQQVYRMARDTAGCHATPTSQAYGQAPLWQLNLGEHSARYAGPAGQEIWTLRGLDDPARPTYHFVTADNGEATLALLPDGCLDRQAGRYELWQASLTRHGTAPVTRRGCAVLARPDATARWVGRYRSHDSLRTQLHTELRLLPDYRAELHSYFPQTGERRVDSGIWQPWHEQALQLLLVHPGTPQQLTEIRFEVDGERLRARQQVVNGQQLDFSQTPLQLQRVSNTAAPERLRRLPPAQLAPVTAKEAALHQTLQQYFRDHRSPLTASRYAYVKYDLNQDGFDDALVMFNWCRQQACTLAVFQGGPQGYRFISRLTDVRTPLMLGAEQHYGWQDLLLNTAPAGSAPRWQKLSFNGIAYPYRPEAGEPVLPQQDTVVLFSPPLQGQWGRPLAN